MYSGSISTFHSITLSPSTGEKKTVTPETSVQFYQFAHLQFRDNSDNFTARLTYQQFKGLG